MRLRRTTTGWRAGRQTSLLLALLVVVGCGAVVGSPREDCVVLAGVYTWNEPADRKLGHQSCYASSSGGLVLGSPDDDAHKPLQE